MNTLQQQLKQLATEPEFIAQFLHDGAYVFPFETQQLTEVTQPIAEETKSQSAYIAPIQPVESVTTPEQPQRIASISEPVKVEPAPPASAVPLAASKEPENVSAAPSWQNKVVVLLPPEPSIKEVQFLHKILAASGITDDQVYLQEKVYQARDLAAFSGSRMVLSFGAVNDFKPDYQLRSKAITVIIADRLSVVETDVEAKKKLWAAMKSFFK